MKISDILNLVNTFEKSHFLSVIEQIISNEPKNKKPIEKILSQIDGQIKNADNLSVSSVFELVKNEYNNHLTHEFSNTTNQLDILIDILIRDGNSLMSREWLLHLYQKELKKIRVRTKQIKEYIEKDSEESRHRDYRIYKECVHTAFNNDIQNNRDSKVTSDEQSILNSLTKELELSDEEVKLINYSVIPLKPIEVDELITYLSKSGIILYSKKNHQIYVPDEIILLLRSLRKREVSDKTFRSVLKQLKDSHINMISRKHNIDWKLQRPQKIREIISEGINFSSTLKNTIHKPGTSKSNKKALLTDLIENKLEIKQRIKGASLEDKLNNFISYLNLKEQEENISISIHGYDKLIKDLVAHSKGFLKNIRFEFELQDSEEITATFLLTHNLKPIDILYTLSQESIKQFCETRKISLRGIEIRNILKAYKDTSNLYLENYSNIANRDLAALNTNGIEIKEADLGIKFEELTSLILSKLGLTVDDKLRSELNTAKNKADIVLRLDDNQVIIVECKTKKDKKFNTYSSTARQIKAYKELAEKSGLGVVKTFLIAPDFSDDFVNECGLDYELNLTLITSQTLLNIYEAFQISKLSKFPITILFRDVLINGDRVIKAILK